MIIIDRILNAVLGPHLRTTETHCHCDNIDCNFTIYAPSTVLSFNSTRAQFEQPIIVNSWYRCQVHNRAVGGVSYSFHMKGLACDLTPLRLDLLELDRLERIAREHFDVVIRYDVFVHCHNMK